jgi:predicted NAD/FAD-binding protein
MNRKKFIQLSLALAGMGSSLGSCSGNKKTKGRIIGASAAVGHLLRDRTFETPAVTIQKDIVIIGGGVSGLSAARHLHQHGITNFTLLELENEPGGNAAFGRNSVSAFPWGAHYVPLPNNDLPEYLAFLTGCGVITAVNSEGVPTYNELHLCFDPQERLYINGLWQDGLVPHYGVPGEDLQQIERFLHLMHTYRYLTGTDGKQAFAIPVDRSSKDETFARLDKLTMKEWLIQNGYTSNYLHTYINYCCRDDYGTPHHITSAWAGIHYFASRKGKATNATYSDVLTWPEGNGFLVNHLRKDINRQIQTGALAVQVKTNAGGVQVIYFDTQAKQIKAIQASHCIMAVPQFIAARLLANEARSKLVKEQLHYTPWVVANLTVRELEERSGAPLSWDNVLFESKGLGYVEATHELLQQKIPRKNLTYYLPLTDQSPGEERKAAQQRKYEDWAELVMTDLQKVHPNIREATEELNIMLWGHAMAQPLPGIIHGSVRAVLSAPVDNRIHFAHSDLAGISIFEEAFYQGLQAAKKIIGTTA